MASNAAGAEHNLIEGKPPFNIIVLAAVGVLLIVLSIAVVVRREAQLSSAVARPSHSLGKDLPAVLGTATADTKGAKVPAVLPEECSPRDTAPKGDTLAYSDENGVYLVVIEGGSIAEGPCLVAPQMGETLVWSGDGTMLAWSSNDSAQFYSPREGRRLGSPPGLPSKINLASSSTGFLALGDRQVWRLTRRAESLDSQSIGSIPKPSEDVTFPSALGLAGSTSDGQPVVIVRDGISPASGRGPTELWTIDSDGQARRIGPSADANGNMIPEVAVDPKGHNVAFVWGDICGNACGAENRLDIYDQQTGALVVHPEAPPMPEHSIFLINSVEYGLDGSLVLGGSAYPDGSDGHPFFVGAGGDQHLYRVEASKMIETGRAASAGKISSHGQLATRGQFAARSSDETLAVTSADGRTATKIADNYLDFVWAPDLGS